MTSVPVELYLALETDILAFAFHILRRGTEQDTGQQEDAADGSAMSEAKHVQNSIPMERLSWFVTLALS